MVYIYEKLKFCPARGGEQETSGWEAECGRTGGNASPGGLASPCFYICLAEPSSGLSVVAGGAISGFVLAWACLVACAASSWACWDGHRGMGVGGAAMSAVGAPLIFLVDHLVMTGRPEGMAACLGHPPQVELLVAASGVLASSRLIFNLGPGATPSVVITPWMAVSGRVLLPCSWCSLVLSRGPFFAGFSGSGLPPPRGG